MLQLSKKEFANLKSQFVTSRIFGGKAGWGGTRKLPHAFTEHGVTMLASVLKSKKAIQMNIAIVRAFVALKQFGLNYKELAEQIAKLKETSENQNEQLNRIYDAIENLLDEKAEQKKWKERERIGYKNQQ